MTEKPREPDIPTIRELLLAAFSAETLVRFCRDRPLFRPVLAEFGPTHGLADMVEELIVFCQTQLRWDDLLREVQQENPRQFAAFRDRLYTTPPVPVAVPARTRGRIRWPWQPPRPGWFWPAAGGVLAALIAMIALLVGPPEPVQGTPTPSPSPEAREPTDTPGPVVVPNLRGQLCVEPFTDLQGSNLRSGSVVWEADGEVGYEFVIRTDPPAGTEVARGSEVALVCSLGPMRPVPDVTGYTADNAEWELESYCSPKPCFKTRRAYETASKPEEVDHIVRTDPPASKVVEPGSLVILYVGVPKVQVRVPEVAKLTVEQAKEQLTARDLSVGELLTESSGTVEADLVIRSDPPFGEMVDAGSEVDLIVSGGPGVVMVPDLIDWTWEAAQAELERLGLQATKTGIQYDDDIVKGNVVETDPDARTSVVPGYEVEVVVSLGLDPDGDRDGDGMPNGWEADKQLDPRANDASSDPDRDGLTNLDEYQNSLDPWGPDFPSIGGALRYRGERLSSITHAIPILDVSGAATSLVTLYDGSLGEFTMYNARAGEYYIHAEIDVDGNGYPRAGDFRSGYVTYNVSSAQQTVRGDIDLQTIIHLTEPVDNAFAIRRYDWQTFDLYDRDELLFAWDSVSGATSYQIIIWEWEYEPASKQLGTVVWTNTEQTSYRPDLPPSSPGRFYRLILNANQPDYLGALYVEYSYSAGVEKVGYEFRVQ